MPFVSTKSAVIAAPQIPGPDVDTALSARQKELELQEAELDRKESDLRLSSAALAPSVHDARWACLREERHALAQKWACLAQDKRLRADRQQMMLSAAMMGAPLAQAASRDAHGGGGLGDGPVLPWAALPPLQHTYCALWSVQQIQWLATAQQQQQADMPAMSCCFQR